MTANDPSTAKTYIGPSDTTVHYESHDATALSKSHDATKPAATLDAKTPTVYADAPPAGKENVQPQPAQEHSSDPADSHAIYKRSICLACQHRRTVVSGKGSVFLLCQSPAVETGWPKYPPQPLASCRHLQKKSVQTESPSAESS